MIKKLPLFEDFAADYKDYTVDKEGELESMLLSEFNKFVWDNEGKITPELVNGLIERLVRDEGLWYTSSMQKDIKAIRRHLGSSITGNTLDAKNVAAKMANFLFNEYQVSNKGTDYMSELTDADASLASDESVAKSDRIRKLLATGNYSPNTIAKATGSSVSLVRGIIKRQASKSNESAGGEPYLPLDPNRSYMDTRKNKSFRITSVDGDDVYVEYFDYKDRKPTGETGKFHKQVVDSAISSGEWEEWKQPFLLEQDDQEIGSVGELYGKFGQQFPHASDAVAYFIFGDKSSDNSVLNAIRGRSGRPKDESTISAFMLDFEYGWENHMEDIEEFVTDWLAD